MTEHVVYVIGAGFSAPFGLPVVANFIERAKDQHILARQGGNSFAAVLLEIDRLAKIKNTYQTDLLNIEEVLSILEIDAFLNRPNIREMFQAFIKSVVNYYTPAFVPREMSPPGNWRGAVFGPNRDLAGLGLFAACVHNVRFGCSDGKITAERAVAPRLRYDVVTLNYDCVLENACTFINTQTVVSSPIAFRRFGSETADGPALAKLHGSVSEGEIIPPTWSKGAHPAIAPRWELARQVLAKAQHIRFVGYSLPVADSYVRYLLKSAALESAHLKTIDVMCLDPDGSVEKRYRDFISLSSLRFSNVNSERLFFMARTMFEQREPLLEPWELLEVAHGEAMNAGRTH